MALCQLSVNQSKFLLRCLHAHNGIFNRKRPDVGFYVCCSNSPYMVQLQLQTADFTILRHRETVMFPARFGKHSGILYRELRKNSGCFCFHFTGCSVDSASSVKWQPAAIEAQKYTASK